MISLGRTFLAAHAVSIVFSIAGMLVALRYPELWADSDAATWTFSFGMRWGGALQIALGAVAVALLGTATLGWRRVATFFALSVTISLGVELLGTGTGWPFGAYEYGEALGPKVGGRVPYAIPLSWFYLGLASYVLGCRLASRGPRALRAATSVAIGAWLLTAWDLVLDPAMAHPSMPLAFWTWHEHGPYFGMPIRNFVAWAGTAVVFMGLSRAAWRSDEVPADAVRWASLVYVLNLVFAAALNASVGLWLPIVFAVLGAAVPVFLLEWRTAARRVAWSS